MTLSPLLRLAGLALILSWWPHLLATAWSDEATDKATEEWAAKREELSEVATRAFAKQDWQEAQQLFHAILEKEPEHPLILANLGAVEYQLGDMKAACHYLEEALRRKGDLHASREMLGMAYYQNKQPYHAISALSRAVADQPKEARAHNQLAVVLQDMEWFDGAEQSLRRAITLDPNYADAHFNLALVYLDRKPQSLQLAKRHYQTARKLGVARDDAVEKRLEVEPSSD